MKKILLIVFFFFLFQWVFAQRAIIQKIQSSSIESVDFANDTLTIIEGSNSFKTHINTGTGNLTLTTVGSSGASTLIGNTLNIPEYTLGGLGGVSGFGTINYLSKFTGTSTLGNSLIYDNGTNVGIGTTTLSSKFNVNGDINIFTGSNYKINGINFGVDNLRQVAGLTPNTGDVIKWNGTDWIVGSVPTSGGQSSGYLNTITTVGTGEGFLYDIYQDSILRSRSLTAENTDLTVYGNGTEIQLRFNPENVNLTEFDSIGFAITESQISDLQNYQLDSDTLLWDATRSWVESKGYITNQTDDQMLAIDSTGRVFTISIEDGNSIKFEDTNTQLTQQQVNAFETDPVYSNSSWFNTTNNSGNWNTAYNWGNHATAGYLSSVPTLNQVLGAGATGIDKTMLLDYTSGTPLELTNGTNSYQFSFIYGSDLSIYGGTYNGSHSELMTFIHDDYVNIPRLKLGYSSVLEAGMLRYNSGSFQGYNGTGWIDFGGDMWMNSTEYSTYINSKDSSNILVVNTQPKIKFVDTDYPNAEFTMSLANDYMTFNYYNGAVTYLSGGFDRYGISTYQLKLSNTYSNYQNIDGVIRYDGNDILARIGGVWKSLTAGASGTGATTFLELTDTPSAYTGNAGKVVKVNSGASGLEFGDPGTGYWTRNATSGLVYPNLTSDKVLIGTTSTLTTDAQVLLQIYGNSYVAGNMTSGSYLRIHEVASPSTPASGWGLVYPKTDGKLYFKNDSGTEYDLTEVGSSTGGGNVYKVGTPVNNQIGVWTGDGTIEGDADLTFDGTNLTVTGNVTSDQNRTQSTLANPSTYDYTSGAKAKINLTADVSDMTITNLPDGSEGSLEVYQDATGNRTFTIAGSTGYTTLKRVGPKTEINLAANSHTTIVYWRTGDILYYGFVDDRVPSSSGGDNWGSQVVVTDTTLTGSGTTASPLSVVSSGGMTDPMTTAGDLIYRNSSNITTRLPRGSNGQVLKATSTGIAWGTDGGSLWTDAGTHTYLSSTTDNLSIGSSSNNGFKLYVSGNGYFTTGLVSGNNIQGKSFSISEEQSTITGITGTEGGVFRVGSNNRPYFVSDYNDGNKVYDLTAGLGVGTSTTIIPENNLHTRITVSASTTITISNSTRLTPGMTGNITVVNTSPQTITFVWAGGTIYISPALNPTGAQVTTSGEGRDVYSWWYDGTEIFINGTKGYQTN